MEKSAPALGIDGHAVHTPRHMGVLLLEHIRCACVHVHSGVQALAGTEQSICSSTIRVQCLSNGVQFVG